MYSDSIFRLYDGIKQAHPDIDDWLTQSIALEFTPGVADFVSAVSLMVTSRDPWESAQVFEKCALVLNGRAVIGDVMQDLSIKEIAYTIKAMKQHFPDEEFNDDVCRYIAYEAGEEGFVILPRELDFVQRFLPAIKLTPEQEQVQNLYLHEVADYMALMDKA